MNKMSLVTNFNNRCQDMKPIGNLQSEINWFQPISEGSSCLGCANLEKSMTIGTIVLEGVLHQKLHGTTF